MKRHVTEPRLEDEQKLNDLAQSLYETRTETFRPLFPWVFVRVLPREQITAGGIVLPGHEQNKTVHEGIVLATWAPIPAIPLVKTHEEDARKSEQDWRVSVSRQYAVVHGGHMESDLKAGDHVLFQFSAGMPVAGFSDTRYRIVKEMAWTKADDGGGIFAVVEHTPAEKRVQDQLATVLATEAGGKTDCSYVRVLKARINDKFVLVERGGYSVTLSGR